MVSVAMRLAHSSTVVFAMAKSENERILFRVRFRPLFTSGQFAVKKGSLFTADLFKEGTTVIEFRAQCPENRVFGPFVSQT